MTTAWDDHATVMARIADRLLDHPAVVDLHAGEFGTVATHLPGHRLVGVRADGASGRVHVCVVAQLGANLPDLAEDLRGRVHAVLDSVAVHVTVGDVVVDDDTPNRAG